eukprot:TRINITY_DN3513_c0_g1_i1.p1 TRINITY_DN3513_c0_g1~~TRINITY_DN3513_c0_g1_i1.p1  ORF type:complete len:358 (-),score=34.15 TRINITY_DN3513_c0_g1_i1:2277-3218(-)
MAQNPLQLDTVIRRVCHYLSGEEIILFVRPVCKSWCQVAEDPQYWQPIKNLLKSPEHVNVEQISALMRLLNKSIINEFSCNQNTQNFGVNDGSWCQTLGGPFSHEVMIWDKPFRNQPVAHTLSSEWEELILSRMWLQFINEMGGEYKISRGLDTTGREWAELAIQINLTEYQKQWNEFNLDVDQLALLGVVRVQHHKTAGVVKCFLVSGSQLLPARRTLPDAFPGTRAFHCRAETEEITGKDSVVQNLVLAIKPGGSQKRVQFGVRGRSDVQGESGPTVLCAGLRVVPVKLVEMLRDNAEKLAEESYQVCLGW